MGVDGLAVSCYDGVKTGEPVGLILTFDLHAMIKPKAQIFAGRLIDGEFTDVFRIWDGHSQTVLAVKAMLEKELPSLDFYWNTVG
jgi:hypothetical protein